MYIDNVQRLERVTAERIVNEAVSWGLSRRRAHEVVGDFLERLPSAVERASDETDGLPDEFIKAVTVQLERVGRL
jgi:hypothetical protein